MAYLEPVIGAFAAFMLGFAWYTVLFGKAWQAETGLSEEDAQGDMLRTHGLAFLMLLIISFGLNVIMSMHTPEEQTTVHGAQHGLMAAGMFAIPALTVHYLYQRKSLKLWLIDAAYVLCFFTLAGAVVGGLQLG